MNLWRYTVMAACLGAAWAGLLDTGAMAAAANSLSWHKSQNRVDAEIDSWDLAQLLEELAAATDWQIFVEPNTQHKVSTKFKSRPPGEALALLLGDLSYALLPQSNAPAKLFVFRTLPQEATQRVRASAKAGSSKAAKPIPNELIVTLKPGAKIDALAKSLGAKVVGRADGLNAYRLQFDSADAAAAAREALKGNEDVASVDSNYSVYHQPTPQELALSSVPTLNLKPKDAGNRIIIGLIDTPIHPPDASYDKLMLPAVSVAGNGQPVDGQITHGDSMAQTILRGVSATLDNADGTRVRILPVDVYGSSPSTTTFEVANGIYQAVNSGATIINLSLGTEGNSDFLHNVIQSAHGQGVLFFAAAGNQPVTTPTYPAAYSEVLGVTAGNSRGELAAYANRGDFVSLVEPGSAVVNFDGKSYLVSGTSTSTAYASGTAAGIADESSKKLSEVAAAMRAMFAFKKSSP